MGETLKKIIALAVRAPSGDNMQPWRFEITQNSIHIFNLPERDKSLYNYKQQGALLAHGALIENISIIAPTYGLRPTVKLFPEGENSDYIADIEFEEAPKIQPELCQYIEKRATNRTRYKDELLTGDQKQFLLSVGESFHGVKLVLEDNSEAILKIAHAISQGDRMIFENEIVHRFLFDHIRWTDEEELQKKDGLYLKTMELTPPQTLIFKIIKKWETMRKFNAIGFPKVAVKSNEELYKHGCGFGAVIVEEINPENYVNAGRRLQEFWLKTCKLNLGLQPLSGIALLRRIILDGDASQYMTPDQIKLITENYQIIKEQFSLSPQEHIAFMFRFGFANKQPSAYTSRLEPQIETKN